MSAAALETFLARLYTDRPFLTRFLADPQQAMSGAGLSAAEQHALEQMDRGDLLLAVQSFERKRHDRSRHRGRRWRLPGAAWATRFIAGLWRRETPLRGR
jgi:hypothetical protein